jgi:hypothetical protein
MSGRTSYLAHANAQMLIAHGSWVGSWQLALALWYLWLCASNFQWMLCLFLFFALLYCMYLYSLLGWVWVWDEVISFFTRERIEQEQSNRAGMSWFRDVKSKTIRSPFPFSFYSANEEPDLTKYHVAIYVLAWSFVSQVELKIKTASLTVSNSEI